MQMIVDISDNDIKWAYDYYKFPDIQSKINTENLARVIRNGISLDKIRAEIEALPKTYPFINHIDTYVKEDDVKKIINKYKIESEKV